MPANIGDIWVLEGFIIVDMPETDDALLGRPILATVGCHIDVRNGRVTFEVEWRYAMFCHMKKDVVSPNCSLLDTLPISPKIDMDNVLNCEDPLDSDYISYEDLD